MHTLKRYSFAFAYDKAREDFVAEPVEHPEGEYVRYEDLVKLIKVEASGPRMATKYCPFFRSPCIRRDCALWRKVHVGVGGEYREFCGVCDTWSE